MRHVLQGPLEPPPGGVPFAQQLHDEQMAVAVVGVRRETLRHQIREDHPARLDPPAQQLAHDPLHLVERPVGEPGGAARARQRLEDAGPRPRPVHRRELHRQPVEKGLGGGRSPEPGPHLGAQQDDAGHDRGRPLGRQQAVRERVDTGQREPFPRRRQGRDLQQVDPGRDGVLGIDDVGQLLDSAPDPLHVLLADRPPEPGGEGRRPAAGAAEDAGSAITAVTAVAAREAPAFRHGAGQDEVGRQVVDHAAEPVVVPRVEADHGPAEQTPGRERRAPGHPLQQGGGPRPVAGVHRLQTGPDLLGVAPQRVARGERVETRPAPLGDEPIRQRPLHPGQGRPLRQMGRIGGHGVRTVEMPDVEDPVVFRQRRRGDGGAIALRAVPHRRRFLAPALGR